MHVYNIVDQLCVCMGVSHEVVSDSSRPYGL